MNFLPFVISFLLLMTVVSSFMFSSTLGTAREKEVILSHHRAYLTLLSKQNKKLFQTKKKPSNEKKEISSIKKQPAQRKSDLRGHRECQMGVRESKLNLWQMIHGSHPDLQRALTLKAERLIEILYGSCEFFQARSKQHVAKAIVQAITQQKIESLEKLHLTDPELGGIYYKMLRGTNTGYPALTEYVVIEDRLSAPVYFRYARQEVLQAVLGVRLTSQILELERKEALTTHRREALRKEQFNQLVRHSSVEDLKPELLPQIFDFRKQAKGIPQTFQDGQSKIRAIRSL